MDSRQVLYTLNQLQLNSHSINYLNLRVTFIKVVKQYQGLQRPKKKYSEQHD